MYFGAGRGPIIKRALKAAKSQNIKIKVIALDKNPKKYYYFEKHDF
jgi:hypothetical protein